MKNSTFLLLLTSIFLISVPVKAQNCSEGLTLVNELWQNFDPMDLVNNKDGLKQQTDKLKNELASFAKFSLKKDAPRLLPVGSGEKKINLKPNKKRIFVTTPIKQESVLLTILRPETGSQATVTICTHTMKGESRNLEKVEIMSQDAGSVEIPLSNTKGKILSINVTNTSQSKINYRITAR